MVLAEAMWTIMPFNNREKEQDPIWDEVGDSMVRVEEAFSDLRNNVIQKMNADLDRGLPMFAR